LAIEFTRLLNIGLRSATLGVRFLFVFFLAKYLDAASVGYYGIFTATTGYALYFVGLDFYTYTTREILKTPTKQRGRLLKGQAALSGFLYITLLPATIFFLSHSDWPDHLVWWFTPILLLEHLNQEISRLLIALSEQLTASFILFIRQGSWAVVITALMRWNHDSRNLDTVMAIWACAGIAAVALGIWRLKQLKIGGWHQPIDWVWIKRGIVVSSGFLVATLALRGIQTIDRYWLKYLGGIEMVGAYVLLLGVASTLLVFLDAGIFAYAYPTLIKHHHNGQHREARTQVKHMFFQTTCFLAVFGFISWILLPYLLRWIGNPLYLQALPLYPWLLAAISINAIGMVPHYALYARGMDKPIIYSHIGALVAFILSTWLLSPKYPAMAIPIGLNIAFSVILILKTIVYFISIRSKIPAKFDPQAA